jgi:hypothetical protein
MDFIGDWRDILAAFDIAFPVYRNRLVYNDNGVWKVYVPAPKLVFVATVDLARKCVDFTKGEL